MSGNELLRPRLIALDLDGTLIDESLTLRPRVVDAIERVRALGITVTIVTGRMFTATRPFAKRLGIESPVACYQGAAIFEASNGRLVSETPVPHDVALEIYAFAKSHGLHVQFYAGDRFFVESINRYSELYARLAMTQPVVVASLPAAFEGRGSTKVNLVTEPERTPAIAAELRSHLGDRAYVTRSNPEFIEMLHPAVNKGRAFVQVAELLNVPLEQTMAIGDSYNDVPLLGAAGFGIAMGSAPSELKDVADAVVDGWKEDGAAEALERYVIGVEVSGRS